MRKIIFSFTALLSFVFFISAVSAFSFSPQLSNLYNLGDFVNTSVIIDQSGNLSSALVCNGITQNINLPAFNNLPLNSLNIPILFQLTQSVIGGDSAQCQLKATLNGNIISSNTFYVSDSVNVTISSLNREFNPGDQVLIQGNAVKDNGQNLNGIVNVNISTGNVSIYQVSNVVNNGYFSFNFSLPAGVAAGQYLVGVNAYEMDSSNVETNRGYTAFNILVDQVPTSLNIVPQINAQTIMPGQGYAVKAILYDQTGQKINSVVNFTINKTNGVISQRANTDELINIPVSYNDPPDTWTVYANSNGLNTQISFTVLENKSISIDLLNRTLLVTNKGNVPYTDPLTVYLGNQSLVFNVSLGVGGTQKYVLSAPDGNYSIEVSSLGNNIYNGNLFLTGDAVNVQQASAGVISFIQYPLVWIAVIVILLVFVFLFLKKLYKKKFRKRINVDKKFMLRDGIVISDDGRDERRSSADRFVNSRNVAELSLSLQGQKHGSTIVCVGIRNFSDIRTGKGGINETMNRIKSIADEFKASVYENGSNIFLIFSPINTKSQNNELSAIQAAEQLQRVLGDHNRLLKQKIDFGISINYGMIVAKQGMNGMKFMTLGNVLSTAKKLAALSRGQVFLSKEVRDRIATDVKTEMHSSGDLNYYTLLEIRDREKSQKFIKEFMNKMEREERERRS